MQSVTEWSVSNVATRILIHSCKFRTANKTFLPLHMFISRNPWQPFAEPWGSAEPSVRNTDIKCNTGSLFYLTLPFVISGRCCAARVGGRLSGLRCEPIGSGSLHFNKLVTLFYPNIIVSTEFPFHPLVVLKWIARTLHQLKKFVLKQNFFLLLGFHIVMITVFLLFAVLLVWRPVASVFIWPDCGLQQVIPCFCSSYLRRRLFEHRKRCLCVSCNNTRRVPQLAKTFVLCTSVLLHWPTSVTLAVCVRDVFGLGLNSLPAIPTASWSYSVSTWKVINV